MPASFARSKKPGRKARPSVPEPGAVSAPFSGPEISTRPGSDVCPCGGGCPRCDSAGEGVQHVLASPGQPLPIDLQISFGKDFGQDFSAVRVHDDAQANASAQMLNARAYTVGTHIAFSRDAFAPERHESRRLLRHELTHVVQQRQSSLLPGRAEEISILPPDHPTEREARRVATATAPDASQRLPPGMWLQRQPVRDTPDAGETWERNKPYQGVPPTVDAGNPPDAGQLDDSKKDDDSEKIDVSARDTTVGMLERLFMAEARTPLQESSYSEEDSLKCMQATAACIVNRKNDAKKRWPNTIEGVVKQAGQFQGFENYPNYGEAQRQHNVEVLKWANQKSKYRAACRTFVKNAKKVAADAVGGKVADPFTKDGGTYGMRTAGTASPGGGFKKVGTAGGNDFYTVT